MKRLLIVSNRLPVTISHTDGVVGVVPSAGGLATGLMGLHQRSDGLWIGWPGSMTGLSEAESTQIEAKLSAMRTLAVHLTDEEVDGFYTKFSNGVLWPLFHYLIDLMPNEPKGWETYEQVNRKFAQAACENYQEGDTIWVHDYQLMLVPQMIREVLPNARIGFFLHIPFPAAEVFRLLPWSHQVLTGMLGADVIGFHTFSYLRQFSNALTQTLGLMPGPGTVVFEGHETRFWAYPMGIDAPGFDAIARDPQVQKQGAELVHKGGDQKLILGVDRMDYTKGIIRRILAIERLLERRQDLRGNLRFVQVAVPSREGVPEYESFTGEVQQLVGRVNGRFSTPTSVPVNFLYQGFSQRDLVALYLAAEVMLVTPLRDGMNLVAKEFVACRVKEDGVLVLSEFAGAAAEMGEAVSINPYDIDGTASAIEYALEMPAAECKTRMRALRERVFTNDVHKWAEKFIGDLEATSNATTQAENKQFEQADSSLAKRVASSELSVLWMLDYDGTLVPFAQRPELALPDASIMALLTELSEAYPDNVHIVSGRTRELMDEWLGNLPIGLHAEHGLWSRMRKGKDWVLNHPVDSSWKESVRPLFQEFASQTPGSLIEEKYASLAWHYRMTDPEYGERQASELKIHLAQTLSNAAVEVLAGNKVIEVKPHGINKGMIVSSLLARHRGVLAIAIGDDETDKSMFRALPEDAISICVGKMASEARYKLPNVRSVRSFLKEVLATRSAYAANRVRQELCE